HRFVGESAASGVSFPDMVRIASAHRIPACRITAENVDALWERALGEDGPELYEVMLDPDQVFEPKLSAKPLPDGRIISPPLEDLYPFLSRTELLENLLVPALED